MVPYSLIAPLISYFVVNANVKVTRFISISNQKVVFSWYFSSISFELMINSPIVVKIVNTWEEAFKKVHSTFLPILTAS